MDVLVFKTNVKSKNALRDIQLQLSQIPDILKWNLDLADCDKVLRIETISLSAQKIIDILHTLGFQCEEL
ncbi:hypothetical protein [Xanthocytophaga agilis]|uniref:HMA domain-containing protein n=1 Tax=Xanthocytophaga agilis TaxID=3048010 RepID=A0AAE3UG64_9BACT|nr:hypothetical protein [Xanthocytophaga agilis]MDJ1504075.1 hypothetical protein [Xanthocytophaga agilis]